MKARFNQILNKFDQGHLEEQDAKVATFGHDSEDFKQEQYGVEIADKENDGDAINIMIGN